MKQVRIPEERLGVLIGRNGSTKEKFQEIVDCEVEMEDNLVTVDGDALDELVARDIVKAIGRGFSPEKAFKLVEEGYTLHILDIKQYADTHKSRERLKGRVIGRDGEARRHIEKDANVDIAVYGSTVGFIGKTGNIELGREAVRMLLQGASHATAYGYLEKNQDKVDV